MSMERRGIPNWSIQAPDQDDDDLGGRARPRAVLPRQLPLDLLPTIVYPQVRERQQSGVAPEVMEETIAKPLEGALAPTEDLEGIETEIQEGQVGVNLDFSYGTDIDFALQDASKNLERPRAGFPRRPIRRRSSSWIRRHADLRGRVLVVRDRSSRCSGWTSGSAAAAVDPGRRLDRDLGGLVREIQVVLDQERLRRYGLSISQVIARSATRTRTWRRGSSLRGARGGGQDLGQVPERARDPRACCWSFADGASRSPRSRRCATRAEQRIWARLDGTPAVDS